MSVAHQLPLEKVQERGLLVGVLFEIPYEIYPRP